MTKQPRIIDVLGQEVDENVLMASLRDILKRRGLTAQLIIEDKETLKMKRAQPHFKESDYANVYKYAFF